MAAPLEGRALLEALVPVEFVVIGGLAVGAHGYVRATKDIDIVPSPAGENLTRLAAVLESLDYEITGLDEFDPDELGIKPDAEGLRSGGNWVLETKYGRLDILQLVEPGLGYSELRAKAVRDTVFGAEVWFCGYEHLVAMKETAGRLEDTLDLQRLREARSED